jgi:hypothetical protein
VLNQIRVHDKGQLLDYLEHTVDMKAIGDQEEADILARRDARKI